ncbi:MAG: ribonucleotide reductase N-terminal alpha domain-containing protein, partial [Spirochaetales bacterium]
MQILKRTGQTEGYIAEKIANAMRAAFKSAGTDDSKVPEMTHEIEDEIKVLAEKNGSVHIETIQDLVEKTLIKYDYHVEVKKFILYREDRTKKRQSLKATVADFTDVAVKTTLRQVQKDYTDDEYSLDILRHKYLSFRKSDMSEAESLAMLIKAAVELTTQEAPQWEFIAARLLMIQFKARLEIELQAHAIASFYDKIHYLTEEGLYGSYILEHYSKKEIDEIEKIILQHESEKESRNNLLTFSSLDLLLRRYVIRTRSHVSIETPQEMFMGIAMHLAINEKTDRLQWVERFYDMLSLLHVTVATPTLSNARKPYHQLSSCFIDTVPDSLDGIYRSIDNFAKVSKLGGGMGLYFGKIRASGSAIRGFQGAAGGVIRWIKIANDTAVAVDQLGVRQGSVAVYLDVWHKDIPEFLQLRTNNGDDRMKAHDVFPAVCYPDLFWKTVQDDIDAPWYLMCPHEIEKVKGYSLEDFYGEEWETRYKDCIADSRISKREISVKDLV